MHGGGAPVTPGAPLNKEYTEENLELLEKGLPNLLQHISNGRAFNLPVVVAINSHRKTQNKFLTKISEGIKISQKKA
ncbi:C-1-tetrahydrofolate synthase, cytoplasmic [Eumeta japonica]|uniref:C-1-tetrahydrofolate synthase, cytoplasmic n=1 Tax=Eumeta variegata TaxID=151549 RepID=A0A4C1TCG4_EUMVA|nr:C-1-tetrahydrofolate synthase, cytoplasmic [Eumeta japonica]